MKFEEIQLLLVTDHATVERLHNRVLLIVTKKFFRSHYWLNDMKKALNFNKILTSGTFHCIWVTNCLILIWLHAFASFLADVDQSNWFRRTAGTCPMQWPISNHSQQRLDIVWCMKQRKLFLGTKWRISYWFNLPIYDNLVFVIISQIVN